MLPLAVSLALLLFSFPRFSFPLQAALSTAVTLKWHREETKKSIMVKEICMLIMALFILGAAIAATVIIVPRSAGVSAPGLPSSIIAQLIAASGKSLAYRDSIVFPARE